MLELKPGADFFKVARAREPTQDLLIGFIFSFHHFTAEPQRLPKPGAGLQDFLKILSTTLYPGRIRSYDP
jgi:hypothetical protein